MDIGYCRVSTQGQTLESQIEQLQTAGCSKIHSEKASGIRSDRAELRGLVKSPEPGSAVGRGEMKAADVVRAMYPDYRDERVTGVCGGRNAAGSVGAVNHRS